MTLKGLRLLAIPTLLCLLAAPALAREGEPPPAPAPRQLCARGDQAACVDHGLQLVADARWNEAARLFRRACDAGELRGCAQLARLVKDGRGVKADRAQALDLAQKACAADEPFGCYVEAVLTESDTSRPARDSGPVAVRLYERACQSKLPEACQELAMAYHRGRAGLPRDLRRARRYLDQACALGDAYACTQATLLPPAQ